MSPVHSKPLSSAPTAPTAPAESSCLSPPFSVLPSPAPSGPLSGKRQSSSAITTASTAAYNFSLLPPSAVDSCPCPGPGSDSGTALHARTGSDKSLSDRGPVASVSALPASPSSSPVEAQVSAPPLPTRSARKRSSCDLNLDSDGPFETSLRGESLARGGLRSHQLPLQKVAQGQPHRGLDQETSVRNAKRRVPARQEQVPPSDSSSSRVQIIGPSCGSSSALAPAERPSAHTPALSPAALAPQSRPPPPPAPPSRSRSRAQPKSKRQASFSLPSESTFQVSPQLIPMSATFPPSSSASTGSYADSNVQELGQGQGQGHGQGQGQSFGHALPPPPTRNCRIIQVVPGQHQTRAKSKPRDSAPASTSTASSCSADGSKAPESVEHPSPAPNSSPFIDANNPASRGTVAADATRTTTGTFTSTSPSAGAPAPPEGPTSAPARPAHDTAQSLVQARKAARKTAHSLIERRRRGKMNDAFRTLRALVPACADGGAGAGAGAGTGTGADRASAHKRRTSDDDDRMADAALSEGEGEGDDTRSGGATNGGGGGADGAAAGNANAPGGIGMHKLAILEATVEYLQYLEKCVDVLKRNAAAETPRRGLGLPPVVSATGPAPGPPPPPPPLSVSAMQLLPRPGLSRCESREGHPATATAMGNGDGDATPGAGQVRPVRECGCAHSPSCPVQRGGCGDPVPGRGSGSAKCASAEDGQTARRIAGEVITNSASLRPRTFSVPGSGPAFGPGFGLGSSRVLAPSPYLSSPPPLSSLSSSSPSFPAPSHPPLPPPPYSTSPFAPSPSSVAPSGPAVPKDRHAGAPFPAVPYAGQAPAAPAPSAQTRPTGHPGRPGPGGVLVPARTGKTPSDLLARPPLCRPGGGAGPTLRPGFDPGPGPGLALRPSFCTDSSLPSSLPSSDPTFLSSHEGSVDTPHAATGFQAVPDSAAQSGGCGALLDRWSGRSLGNTGGGGAGGGAGRREDDETAVALLMLGSSGAGTGAGAGTGVSLGPGSRPDEGWARQGGRKSAEDGGPASRLTGVEGGKENRDPGIRTGFGGAERRKGRSGGGGGGGGGLSVRDLLL